MEEDWFAYLWPKKESRSGRPIHISAVQRKSRTIARMMPAMTHTPRLPCSTAERVGGICVNGRSGAADLALKIASAQAERSAVRKNSRPPLSNSTYSAASYVWAEYPDCLCERLTSLRAALATRRNG